MPAEGLIGLAINERDDVVGRGERLSDSHSRLVLLSRLFSWLFNRGFAQPHHGFVHRAEERRDVFCLSTGVGIRKPSNRELSCKLYG
jgi:hypothetical protein